MGERFPARSAPSSVKTLVPRTSGSVIDHGVPVSRPTWVAPRQAITVSAGTAVPTGTPVRTIEFRDVCFGGGGEGTGTEGATRSSTVRAYLAAPATGFPAASMLSACAKKNQDPSGTSVSVLSLPSHSNVWSPAAAAES